MRHQMNVAGAGALVGASVAIASLAVVAARCDAGEKVPVRTAIYRAADGDAPVQQVRYGWGGGSRGYGANRGYAGRGRRYGYYRPFGYGGYYRGGFYGPYYGGYGLGGGYGYGYGMGYPTYGYSYMYPGYGFGYSGYPSVGVGIW